MAKIMYDGSALDTICEPAEFHRGVDGRPLYNKPAKRTSHKTKPIEVFHLWGQEFPTDVPMDVDDALARKAAALSCFKILEAPAPATAKRARALRRELAGMVPVRIETAPEPVAYAEPEQAYEAPKRRGRPRKSAEE